MKAQLEPIASTEETSLHSRLIAELTFRHPMHYHPEIELTYIVRSKGTRVIGDHVGNFDEGDLCLIGADLPHLYTNTVAPTQGAQAEVLQFHRHFSNGFIDATPELLPFARLLDQAKLGLAFRPETAHQAAPIMSKIREAKGFRRMRLFMELIDCLIHAPDAHSLASPGYTGSISALGSERMQIAYHYIMEHFSEEIDHRALAAMVHLAPESFSRQFKRLTRKTCTAFINDIRLGHACRLLLESDTPITKIAFDCGFRNLSNFNRRFREQYHCSPRDYRRHDKNQQRS